MAIDPVLAAELALSSSRYPADVVKWDPTMPITECHVGFARQQPTNLVGCFEVLSLRQMASRGGRKKITIVFGLGWYEISVVVALLYIEEFSSIFELIEVMSI
ncbi:hypothetical protein COLO4_37518 [Corchorus olitorius]|uniref:Uncharacterized protein n=1 Tax=Corchorus olitorius TaxID=93759 RepID=A0A1R3G141_9ROSI|nr:hypothetical protein COLO4_37518 [Corchorus olitorius]